MRYQGCKKTSGGVGVSIILIVVMISQVYTFVRTYEILRLIYVQFVECQLYLSKAVKNDYGWALARQVKLVVIFLPY